MWKHSYQIIQWVFSACWIKESVCQKKSFSSHEQKDEMLISCGEHSTADSCFIMLVLQTQTSCYSLLITKGLGGGEGQLTFSLESKNLNIFSPILRKRKHSWFVSRLNTTTACVVWSQLKYNLMTYKLNWEIKLVYSTSFMHSTSECTMKPFHVMQHQDECKESM